MRRLAVFLAVSVAIVLSDGCSVITVPYHAAKNVVEGGVWVVKATYVVVAFHLIGRGEDFNLGLVRTERRPLGP